MTLRDEISHFFSIYKKPDWKVVKVTAGTTARRRWSRSSAPRSASARARAASQSQSGATGLPGSRLSGCW